MLIHSIVERLRALGLAAMADTLTELQNSPEAAEMPHSDWFGHLVDREVSACDNRRLVRHLCEGASSRQHRECRLSHRSRSRPFALSYFRHLPMDPRAQPSRHREATRTGKSWLACALGAAQERRVSKKSPSGPPGWLHLASIRRCEHIAEIARSRTTRLTRQKACSIVFPHGT